MSDGTAEPRLSSLDEAAVIALFADPATPAFPEVLVPNGDDAAAWAVRAGMAQVATTDGLVEGVHFLRGGPDPGPQPAPATSSPHAVGRKLMAVNLSDLAAMGAEPRYALIAVCLPESLPVAYAREVGRGIREAAVEHGVHVIGGNVTRSPGPVVLHATLIGEVAPRHLVRRLGAQPGDRLFVSGALGGARLAHRARTQGRDAGLVGARLDDPRPRVALGRALAESGAVRAMCDVSDGLARDATRLLAASGCGAHLEVAALPVDAATRALAVDLQLDVVEEALIGGEDYELLFAVAPGDQVRAHEAAGRSGVPITEIGVVTAERAVVRSDGRTLGRGFEHFRGG